MRLSNHMIEKPILDEQKNEELNNTILTAMEEKNLYTFRFIKVDS
jgi:hypothetical protein